MYVNPKLQPRLDSLSPELRAAILARGGSLNTLYDLIGALDAIIQEQEQDS